MYRRYLNPAWQFLSGRTPNGMTIAVDAAISYKMHKPFAVPGNIPKKHITLNDRVLVRTHVNDGHRTVPHANGVKAKFSPCDPSEV